MGSDRAPCVGTVMWLPITAECEARVIEGRERFVFDAVNVETGWEILLPSRC